MSHKQGRHRYYIFVALAVILLFLHLLPFLFPQARLWGFNHLLFLPAQFLVAYLVGAALILGGILIPPLRQLAGSTCDGIAAFLFGPHRARRWTVIALVMIPFFYLLRLTVYVVGDSVALIANIDADMPVIFKWSETGAIYAAYAVSKILTWQNLGHAANAYVIISILSGAVAVWFFFGIGNELGREKAEKLLIALLLIFGGWGLLFFGYTENYPILWPFMAGYIYFAVKALKNDTSILWPLIFLAIGLALHLQIMFFILSGIVLVLARLKKSKFHRKYARAIYSLLAVMALAAVAAFVILYRSSYEVQHNLMPFLEGRRATPDYWLFSPRHLADIANQLILLVPVLPLLIIISRWRWNEWPKLGVNGFLLWFSVGGLGFLFLIEPKLGMGRDWDLFALAGIGPLLLLARNISMAEGFKKTVYAGLILLSAVMVFPWISSFLRDKSAIESYKYLLTLDLPRSRTGLIQLRNLYNFAGDKAASDSVEKIVNENFPSHILVPKALELLEHDRYEEALEIADQVAVFDSESAEYLNLRGLIYSEMGKFDSALAYMEPAARIGHYDHRFLTNLAQLYFRMKRYDDMMVVLRRAQKLAPDNADVLNGLMANFFVTQHYDSATAYAKQIYEIDSLPNAIYVLGFSAYEMRQGSAAENYFRRYLEIGDDSIKLRQVAIYLRRLEEIKTGQQTQP